MESVKKGGRPGSMSSPVPSSMSNLVGLGGLPRSIAEEDEELV